MSKGKWGLRVGIALITIILLTILGAPASNQLKSGSTYSRAADGYAAWYDYMRERGTPLQRWQKPPGDWLKSSPKTNQTLIRVYSQPSWRGFSPEEYKWGQNGNRLVILGLKTPATPASFTSYLDSNAGKVRIDTTRREKNGEPILADNFGSVVWAEKINKGEIIYVGTPHLAANAYQDNPANYEFLAQLVTKDNYSPWVDEYIHGYKDKDVIEQEVGTNIWSYWRKTPIILLVFQGLVILFLAIWSENCRLGKAASLTSPQINNTEAYVEALAKVLYRANSSDFVVSAISQAETKQLQRELGLETSELRVIIDYWIQQQGGNSKELAILLKTAQTRKKVGDMELLTWLQTWQELKKQINLKKKI
jgi:hypothetical protein